MKDRRRHQRGQVLIMVTLVLISMCGVLGLAVDLGWSYFTKKSAQAAADAAALAAVQAAMASVPVVGPYTCDQVTCVATPTPCSSIGSGSNLYKGCQYALQNGFAAGGKDGRQNVMIQSGVSSPPPTAPGVQTYYWVTVRTYEAIPQLFSSVLGNTMGAVSARATAGLVLSSGMGALILLNRQNDCMPLENGAQLQCGVDLLVQANDNAGMYALQSDGGILLASTANGSGNGRYAGENQGGGTVKAPFTYIRETGSYYTGGSSSWNETPLNGRADGDAFRDPMRGKYQPPPPAANKVVEPAAYPQGVVGGIITGSNDVNNPLVLLPGAYYASAENSKTGEIYATGEPIQISGAVEFSSGSSDFAEYVFFGGISAVQQGQGATSFRFSPGRYVFAGSTPQPNGTPNPVFDITTNLTMTDGTPAFQSNTGENSSPGEIFIFTDTNYVGWDWTTNSAVALQVPSMLTQDRGGSLGSVADQLEFGISGFQAGNNTDVVVNLHGINPDNSAVPGNLAAFEAPILLWQDQNNSVIKYYDNPADPTSFNRGCVVGDDVTYCSNIRLASNKSPELFFKASPGSSLYGVIYQPRGSWTTLGGGSGYSGPLQIVSGGFKIQGNAVLRLAGLPNPMLRPVAALIE
ncbi:MAG: pilus assembly protein TadG-related protein [Bryobacteraceae bacterium]